MCYLLQKSTVRDRRVPEIAEKVVGVVEVDSYYLDAIHNKQEFRETKEYMYDVC